MDSALRKEHLLAFVTARNLARAGGLTSRERTRRERVALKLRDRVVAENMGLVFRLTAPYARRFRIDSDDIDQDGVIGLLRALEDYDPKTGALGTYATWWIRQAFERANRDARETVRIPVHAREWRSTVRRTSNALAKDLGRDPTDEEIAEACRCSIDRVRKAHAMPGLPTSLDVPLETTDDGPLRDTLGDRIADDHAPRADDVVGDAEVRRVIDEMLSRTMSERHAYVLRRRFGIDARDDGATLGEIAKDLGVTRERVRQIESKALAKLRGGSRAGMLRRACGVG